MTDLAADLLRLGGVVEEEARDVAGVDHLHHQADAGLLELLRGVAQVFDKGDFQLAEIGATRGDAGQAVDLGVAQHLGVGDGLVHAGAELLDPLRQDGDATLAAGPVTGRHVEQHLGQLVGIQLSLDLLGREVIGEQVLDTGKAGLGGSGEAVHEVLLGEQHRQVGGKAGHGFLLICRDHIRFRIAVAWWPPWVLRLRWICFAISTLRLHWLAWRRVDNAACGLSTVSHGFNPAIQPPSARPRGSWPAPRTR